MKITMEGKYAFRHNPAEQVRIICVDRVKGTSSPIICLDKYGTVGYRREDGRYDPSFESKYDLVPLQERPIERWGITNSDGSYYSSVPNKQLAEKTAERRRGRYFLMREVQE